MSTLHETIRARLDEVIPLDDRPCVREGLTPGYDLDKPNKLIVDCEAHGFIGLIDVGDDEYGRAETLFQQHVEAVPGEHSV